jgi:hypothetical protein
MKGRASMEIGECRRQFDEEGTVVLAADEGPLDASQWNRLDALTAPGSLPFEHVELGDTGDRHRVEVGRFFTDSDRPRAVHSAAHDVLGVIDGPAMRRLHEELLGRTGLTIRRCQVNVLREGGFVGLHVDRDANPDYLAAVVLQLGKDYEGGDYVVHHDRHGTLGYRIPHHSILVSRCDLSHEVTPVTRGVRKTLVYFLAAHAGENRRRLVGDVGRG